MGKDNVEQISADDALQKARNRISNSENFRGTSWIESNKQFFVLSVAVLGYSIYNLTSIVQNEKFSQFVETYREFFALKLIIEASPTFPIFLSFGAVVLCLLNSSLTSRLANDQAAFEEAESKLILKRLQRKNTSQDASDMINDRVRLWLYERVDKRVRRINILKTMSLYMCCASILLIIFVSTYVSALEKTGG